MLVVCRTCAALGALSAQVLKAVLNAEGVLGAGTLSKQEQETIKLLVSELTGCDYCVAARTVIGKMTGLSAESLRQIRAGEPTGDARRDALARFVRQVQTTSDMINAQQYEAIRAAGYSETQLVEIALAIAHPCRIQMATMKATGFVKPSPAVRHCLQE